MSLKQAWRWFGPQDPVPLQHIRQAGASVVVTALHHIPYGEVWPLEEIRERKAMIEAAGLSWEVVESVPVHEDIKRRCGDYQRHIRNYQQTLTNLGACDIHTVCYNFMPVLDWSRTEVEYELPDGSRALRFERMAFAAFDLYILKRPGAQKDYSAEDQSKAKARFDAMTELQRQRLRDSILMGFPGSTEEHSYDLDSFQAMLDSYGGIDSRKLKDNLILFLKEVVPAAEAADVKLAIHPDDPPFSLLGLPRVVSTESDAREIFDAVPSPSNGLTMCAGSFGARLDNDLVGIVNRLGNYINFIHLRTTIHDAEGNFHEACHLDGNADMYELMKSIVLLQRKRQVSIPMRPDHGHQMLDDLNKKTYAGYSAIGRLKGLAELRGLELGIERSV